MVLHLLPFWPGRRPGDGGGDQQAPLPPVLPPEAPGRREGAYLKRVLSESRELLDQDPSGFKVIASEPGWSVAIRPVEGSRLTMARLEADVPMPAARLFDLLRTMDGKRVIDPFPREHHAEPLKALRLRGGRAEVVYSEAPRFHGLLRPREYVTCDASAPKERLFACKSTLVKEGRFAKAAKGKVRANLLFAMRTRDIQGRPGSCHLQMINWLDLGANTVPPLVANAVTERWYFQGVKRRLDRYIRDHGLADQKAAGA